MDNPAISARGLQCHYGKHRALAPLDLDIAAGQVTAVLGPNGAGKSTLVGLVLGRTRASGGSVSVLGHAAGTLPARLGTGAMLQSAGLPAQLTVAELVENFAAHYADPMPLAEAIDCAGLGELAGRRYGTLSGGQQRRVQFALALCGRPRLLLLDEPTVALDVAARRAVWAVIRRVAAQGTSVLLTTHQLDEAEALAGRVVVIAAGRVVADGTPAEVKARVGGASIRCRTKLAAEAVARWPGVRSVVAAGQHLLVQCAAADPVVRELMAHDPGLEDLSVSGTTLEDAVDSLTAMTLH